MDVFRFRDRVIEDYRSFTTSFTKIQADDIRRFVEHSYSEGRFWPAPLLQLNPNFVRGGLIDDFVGEGLLHPECAKIFRLEKTAESIGKPMALHKHQEAGIRVARKGESYVLTTGTGSGKSLSYFIPIIDHVLRKKKIGQSQKNITAIVIYPMNALCNSQKDELERFLVQGYPHGSPVTFARYTGQESTEDREAMQSNPPDILLTNYVMLELIMTRQQLPDLKIVEAAQGLDFLVLDELHTYRGRQGADVALLVRRVREALNPNLLCVGTSATMVSEGDSAARKKVVAKVATKLFGGLVKPENVITETLKRVTPEGAEPDPKTLKQLIESGIPAQSGFEELQKHPLSAWIELNLGLLWEEEKWVRRSPQSIKEGADLLARASGVNSEVCAKYLADFLLLSYNTRDTEGRSLFAFRLHQFVSGAGTVYSTLEPQGSRFMTVEAQQFQPGHRDKQLFGMCFCRECGQEYFPVWARMAEKQATELTPRELSEKTREDSDDETRFGFFMPDPDRCFDPNDIENSFPEEWLELRSNQTQIKYSYKKYCPQAVRIEPSGAMSPAGMPGWFMPGGFRFCLNPDCRISYDGSVRSDFTKLSTLTSEGRSSATTLLTLSALRYLLDEAKDLHPRAKKLLGFTDNRQDASLQAGHFNDFLQILLLRGALLASIQDSPEHVLNDENITKEVFNHLHLAPEEYSANPDARGIRVENIKKTLRDLLGYRLYYDLRRGWRIMNPNLEQLGLLEIRYLGLDESCEDEQLWGEKHPLLAKAKPEARKKILRALLDSMRRGLCVKTIYLNTEHQEQIRNRAYNDLRPPWGLTIDEKLFSGAVMIPAPKLPTDRYLVATLHLGVRSRFGRILKIPSTWETASNASPVKVTDKVYEEMIGGILDVLSKHGLIQTVDISDGKTGYLIDSQIMQWTLPEKDPKIEDATNRFFFTLYGNIAESLKNKDRLLHFLRAAEHTAQVDNETRKERETLFREGFATVLDDNGRFKERKGTAAPVAVLPLLFCSPTMELGVDISTLNTVFMRNVPPTPANYAQRSGRAGRSGQPALVITYCANRSPHDQYFFTNPVRMVAGSVNPPTLDLANEDLVKSHLHALWLAQTGQKLEPAIQAILDMETIKTLPVRNDLASSMTKPHIREKATARGLTILKMLNEYLTADSAPWFTEDWVERVFKQAFLIFESSFDRWRNMYKATRDQMDKTHAIQMNPVAIEKERKEARQRYDEARMQQEILLQSRPDLNSDFYTYRYLAGQGFLPGYNFPRLPLMAFIPGFKERVERKFSFLSRPRFLGLSEFGPQTLIYHEGHRFQVVKAILAARDAETISTGANLPVRTAELCPSCGYGYFGEQQVPDRCINCDAKMGGGLALNSLYRIEQVSTRRADRITSDEEDRKRLGYDMQTTVQFPLENGKPKTTKVLFTHDTEEILEISFSPAATVWLMNLGWKNRKIKTVYGFNIDVATGLWSRDSQSPEEDEDQPGEGKVVQRITPFVEDRRNILIVSPKVKLDPNVLTSLEYALKRGIEAVFQLEEDELAAQPLPSRVDKRTILFYESAEGGAGVLTRLATDLDLIQQVAQRSLEICHFRSKSGHWSGLDDLEDVRPDCEAGCYKCLLSYYNQTEHKEIDRRSPALLEYLFRLLRMKGTKKVVSTSTGDLFAELLRLSQSSLEKEWLGFLRDQNYFIPDKANHLLAEFHTRPDFIYSTRHVLIYIDGPHHEGDARKKLDQAQTTKLLDQGFEVIRFPKEKDTWPGLVAKYPDVFGKGRKK